MDIYKNIKTEENYNKLLKSGMFWEFHPELKGEWEEDKKLIIGVVVRQSEQLVYECKVCGKPFGDNLSLYEHYNEEHN